MNDDIFVGYVKQLHKSVYRLVYSYVKNEADAEDICQEAFVKLLLYQGDFPSDEDCKRWLIRVAVNLSKNLLSSSHRKRTEELREDIPFISSEDKELWTLVKSLPPKCSRVIHLFYYEVYSVNEISDILGISRTAVTSQLLRGRKKLRSLLTEGASYE